MREWLPKLVGIERSIALRVGTGVDAITVRAAPEPAHAEQLTREEVTAAVHYVFWELTPEQADAVATGPVTLVIDHPSYPEETDLSSETLEELRADLAG
jgi:hypothetical protein